MDATKGKIYAILNGNKQFLIPVYRRYYSWETEQCSLLWNDIVDMQKKNKVGPFVGFIVDYKQLFGQFQAAMKDYTSGAFEGYDPEDVKGLVKDCHDATVSYFEEVYDAVEELCEGVEEPRREIQYIHYFCGVSGQSEESDEIYAHLRENNSEA